MAHASVLIIDDHDIVRFGLETLLLAEPSLSLVGSSSSLRQGIGMIEAHAPDLVITDMTLQDSGGLDTVRAVVQAQAGRRVLVVTMQDELMYGEQVLGMGAQGYVMKESAHAQVLPAARAVLAGETWVSPALSARLLDRLLQRRRADTPSSEALSLRELEVLELLRTAKTSKEIAAALGISVRTVDLHRASIKRKLGLRTAVEVVAFAFNLRPR